MSESTYGVHGEGVDPLTHPDEVDLLDRPDPLGSDWSAAERPAGHDTTVYEVTEGSETRGVVTVHHVKNTDLRLAYPVGLRDRLLEPSDDAVAGALQLVAERIFEADPATRRLVVAAAAEDLPAMQRAEAAGFRYVVDVEIPGQVLELFVAEPAWVLEESRRIDDVPTDSGV